MLFRDTGGGPEIQAFRLDVHARARAVLVELHPRAEPGAAARARARAAHRAAEHGHGRARPVVDGDAGGDQGGDRRRHHPGLARRAHLRMGDERATVVCLHGLGRAPSDWDGVRAGLEAFGSVRCPALPRRHADAMAAASAATEPGAIVVGHSMGALIALRLAADPRRSVRALVLTGCFFPPARNGRSTTASVADYAAHRVAFARAAMAVVRARPPGVARRARWLRSPGSRGAPRASTRSRGPSRRPSPCCTPETTITSRWTSRSPLGLAGPTGTSTSSSAADTTSTSIARTNG